MIVKGDKIYMTREERVRAAIKGEEVDRVPISVWMHLPEFDQNPAVLAEESVAYNERYDFDFIKMMPFGLYSTEDWGCKVKYFCDKRAAIRVGSLVETPEQYSRLEVLPATFGTWGKQVEFAQRLSKAVKPGTPFIQTIFNPLTTLRKLVGDRIFDDMKNYPKELHQALDVITETTINFINANIEAGVSGFFFATQTAQRELMSDAEYDEYAKAYDFKVIKSYCDKTWFNVAHIHGTGNIRFKEIATEYPVNVINWHDRNTAPDFAEARKITDKCLLGGILEAPRMQGNVEIHECFLKNNKPEDIVAHVKEAIALAGERKLIIGPGCVADTEVGDEKLLAARRGVDR